MAFIVPLQHELKPSLDLGDEPPDLGCSGRSPVPGASIAATAKPQEVT
jgi:hypothetical protein